MVPPLQMVPSCTPTKQLKKMLKTYGEQGAMCVN